MVLESKRKSGVKYLVFICIVALLVLADQLTKHTAVSFLKGKDSVHVAGDILVFRYLENSGAAWGIMSGKTYIFTSFTVITLLFLIFLIIRIENVLDRMTSRSAAVFFQYLLVMLISGAVGNLIDRIRLGYVIDFIYFKVIDFPTFNLADCYVTISTIFLLFLLLFKVNEKDWSAIF